MRPAARLVSPPYDWVGAKPSCQELDELIVEASGLLHKLMLRKPEPAAITVLTDQQTDQLDDAFGRSDQVRNSPQSSP